MWVRVRCQSVGDPERSATAADRQTSPARASCATGLRVQPQFRILADRNIVIISPALTCSHAGDCRQGGCGEKPYIANFVAVIWCGHRPSSVGLGNSAVGTVPVAGGELGPWGC